MRRLTVLLLCVLLAGQVWSGPTVTRHQAWFLVFSTHWPGSGLSHYVNIFEDRESCERSLSTVVMNDTGGGENEWLATMRCVPAGNRAEAIGRTFNGELLE